MEEEKTQGNFFDRLPPEVVARIKERRLLISDVEKDTKEDFKVLAKTYFNNSYPATIKYLLGIERAMSASSSNELEARVDTLAQMIADLQSKLNSLTQEPERKKRQMNDRSTR